MLARTCLPPVLASHMHACAPQWLRPNASGLVACHAHFGARHCCVAANNCQRVSAECTADNGLSNHPRASCTPHPMLLTCSSSCHQSGACKIVTGEFARCLLACGCHACGMLCGCALSLPWSLVVSVVAEPQKLAGTVLLQPAGATLVAAVQHSPLHLTPLSLRCTCTTHADACGLKFHRMLVSSRSCQDSAKPGCLAFYV